MRLLTQSLQCPRPWPETPYSGTYFIPQQSQKANAIKNSVLQMKILRGKVIFPKSPGLTHKQTDSGICHNHRLVSMSSQVDSNYV